MSIFIFKYQVSTSVDKVGSMPRPASDKEQAEWDSKNSSSES